MLISEILLLLSILLFLVIEITLRARFYLLLLLLYLVLLHHHLCWLLLTDNLTLHWAPLTRYVVIQPNILRTLNFVNTVILLILHHVWSSIVRHVQSFYFVLLHRHAMLLRVWGAYSLIIVLIALNWYLTRLLSNVVTNPLMLVENKRVSVGVHRLLLLLFDALITLNLWSVNLKLLQFAPSRNISKLLSTVVKNWTIRLRIWYAYGNVWRRHRADTSVNCLHLLSIDHTNWKVFGIMLHIFPHFHQFFLWHLASFLHEL